MGYAVMTHAGRVREINEDGYYADGRLFVVADGMGGHQAGEVASSLAIEVFVNILESRGSGEILEVMLKAMQEANRAIRKEGRDKPSWQGMGTTLTAAFLQSEEVFIAHVGDSRAYLFDGESLRQLTQDHSLVAELVQAGKLRPEEARVHPQRNIITRALGIGEEVEADLLSLDRPAGGLLLLCTDGLSSELSDEEMLDLLRKEKAEGAGAEDMAKKLLEAALDRGGGDNITLILVELEPEPSAGSFAGTSACASTLPAGPVGSGCGPSEEDGASATARTKAPSERSSPRQRTGIRLIVPVSLALLLLSALALFVFVPYLKSRSYYVGIDESGNITLYRGLPWKPLGINLSEALRTSLAPAENLPAKKRELLLHPKVMDLEGAEREFSSLTREAQSGVRVPDFLGMTWDEAEELARKAELVLIPEGEVPPPPGSRIVRQSPQAGELAYKLDRVTVELEETSFEEEERPVMPLSPPGQGED